MINIAICDSSQEDIKELSERLYRVAKKDELEICITTYSSGDKLLFDWEDNFRFADILYLDAHISGSEGILIAEKLRNMGYVGEIIYYTYSEIEVFDAFDVDAFHYMLKGATSDDKFDRIFCNAVEHLDQRVREYITLASIGETKSIAIKDLKYFIVRERIMTVYYGKDKTFELYTTVDKLLLTLSSRGFIQLNRNVIVNMGYIESRTRTQVAMKDGEVFTMGRVYKKEALDDIAEFFGEV
jgi:DNA-binding LytR/AlgR family response regulator